MTEIAASAGSLEKLRLSVLKSKMKCDPEGYEKELSLVYSQFKSWLKEFEQQGAFIFTAFRIIDCDPTLISVRTMFLAHITPIYPRQLAEFPKELANFLRSAVRTLPSFLRCQMTRALIILVNLQTVEIGEILALFMELQTLGDRNLQKLAFTHVIRTIKRMNEKHQNEARNRSLQNILFPMLQEHEAIARRALVTLCYLYRRKVWFDDTTANAICSARFHTSPKIMHAASSFLLSYKNIEDDESSSEDDIEAV